MSRRARGFCVLLASGLMLLAALLLLVPAGPVLSQTKKGSIKPYLNNLINWFKNSDLNGDGYLDKDELAKAFRGPNAKAYDYQDPSKPRTDDSESSSTPAKVRPMSLALVCLPTAGLASHLTLAELLTQPTEKKAKKTTTPNYNLLPDYQFLVTVDTDGDKKVSRAEFNVWAKVYATQLKQQADLQKALAKTQQQLAKASAKNAQKYANALRQQQQQLAALNAQMNQAYARVLAATLR
jgi:EF hand